MANIDRLTAAVLAAACCARDARHDRYFDAYDFFHTGNGDYLGWAINRAKDDFERTPLEQTLFLNCVPKSGTHLLRNILFMFVADENLYHEDFIQTANWQQHAHVFSSPQPRLCWGHLDYEDWIGQALVNTGMVLLIRDPYDYVSSYARFLMSGIPDSTLGHFIVDNELSYEQVLLMVILGVETESMYFSGINSVYSRNALAWKDRARKIIKYEELIHNISQLETLGAEAYFRELLKSCGIDGLPSDWRERIRAGSDRRLSWTARENLGHRPNLPDKLSPLHKQWVDQAAPGLRAALGYV